MGSDVLADWHPDGCIVDHLPYESPIATAGNLSTERTEKLKYIILHCLDKNILKDGIEELFQQLGVSAHYSIDIDGTIKEHVSSDRVAYHAGPSAWKSLDETPTNDRGTHTQNLNSIGIEFLCPGYAKGGDDLFHFEPFTDEQRAAGIALVSQLVARFKINPENILGHSDIAPLRKTDPGATFFWKALWEKARLGLPVLDWADGVPMEIIDAQRALKNIGYCTTPETGILDEPTARGILAFQQHFVQSRFEDENYAKTLLATLNIERALDPKTLGALQYLRGFRK